MKPKFLRQRQTSCLPVVFSWPCALPLTGKGGRNNGLRQLVEVTGKHTVPAIPGTQMLRNLAAL